MQAAACSMCRERARNCERASACACREFDAHNSFDKQVAIIHPEPQRTTLIYTNTGGVFSRTYTFPTDKRMRFFHRERERINHFRVCVQWLWIYLR